MSTSTTEQQTQCPPPCCQPGDILCISIPCPVQIVLLGIRLNLTLPCLRLFSGTGAPMTAAQVNQLLGVLGGLLGNLGTGVQGAAAKVEA
jgi:hypothetical protein